MASFGVRTISHLSIELLKTSSGIEFVHIPYTGGAAMVPEHHLRQGPGRRRRAAELAAAHQERLDARAPAILSKARTPVLPDVPTLAEFIPGFEATTWNAVGAPRGTPPEIVERLNREINAGRRTQPCSSASPTSAARRSG